MSGEIALGIKVKILVKQIQKKRNCCSDERCSCWRRNAEVLTGLKPDFPSMDTFSCSLTYGEQSVNNIPANFSQYNKYKNLE